MLLGSRHHVVSGDPEGNSWFSRLSANVDDIVSSFCLYLWGSPCTFWTRTLMLSPNCLMPCNSRQAQRTTTFSRTNEVGKSRGSSFLYCFVLFCESLSLPHPLHSLLFSSLPLIPPLHPCPGSPESHCISPGWPWTPDPLAGASQVLGLQVHAVTASSSSSLSVHGTLFPINAFQPI